MKVVIDQILLRKIFHNDELSNDELTEINRVLDDTDFLSDRIDEIRSKEINKKLLEESKVVETRLKLGVSIREMMNFMGYQSKRSITKFERGEVNPSKYIKAIKLLVSTRKVMDADRLRNLEQLPSSHQDRLTDEIFNSLRRKAVEDELAGITHEW